MIYGDYDYRLTVTQKINILATRTSILVAGKAPYFNQSTGYYKVSTSFLSFTKVNTFHYGKSVIAQPMHIYSTNL